MCTGTVAQTKVCATDRTIGKRRPFWLPNRVAQLSSNATEFCNRRESREARFKPFRKDSAFAPASHTCCLTGFSVPLLPAPRFLRLNALTGGSNAAAVSADNLLMARALADAGKVALPPNLPLVGGGGSSFDSLWNQWVSNVGLHQDTFGQSEFWHGVLDMLEPMATATYTVEATGVEFQVWAGDTITVTDSNGYTAKFQFTPGAPTNWTYVPNSIRDPKGNSVPNTGSNLPVPGGISQPGGSIDVSLPGGGFDNFWILPWYDNTTPGGVVTVGALQPDGYIECPTLTCTAPQ